MKERVDFVKWFSELNKDSGNTVGGKGANLAEIYNLKMPVPPGFVVTAQAYDYFLEKAGLKEKLQEILSKIDYENTKQLEQSTKTIRELILNAELPQEMKTEIIESYENLSVDKSQLKDPSKVIDASSEPAFVAVRSSATAEDLAEASFAGQQDSFVNIKGNEQLLEHIKKCFASLFTARATYYRHKKGFKHEQVSLAVVVQKMIDSYKSGVIFSKDPAHKNENTIIEAVWGLGEGIVSGKITPDKYIVSKDLEILEKKISIKKTAITRNETGEKVEERLNEKVSKAQVLKDHEIIKLAEYALKLETHYKKPQDIEFALENDEIFILQTRPITTIETRAQEIKEIQGEVILSGIAASPGIASGKIKLVQTMEDLKKITKGDVLVTKMTNPDMVVTMQKSAAIVTDEGGMTSHAAIVSREMGIPAIVGTQEATQKLKEGELITINGFTGKIYKGKAAETVQKEVLPVVPTKTKIKVIVDLPSFAKRAAQSQVKAVGLTRIEGIIAESGKHPNFFLQNNQMQDYEEIIFKGIKTIANHFEEVWVRTSDLRTDEYANLEGAPQEKEGNPMLGMHGIRYGIKNPELLKAELNALKRVADQGKIMGILIPQLISVDELEKVKQVVNEIGFSTIKIGVMIETPASVQIIKELCDNGIKFVSFGTNDLTQYTLAIDRNNPEVQYLHNELHPAVLSQIKYVISICKQAGVETSICGQAGSKKEMVEVLVKMGIDSISVNADIAQEISKLVAQLEANPVQEKPVEEEKPVDKLVEQPTTEPEQIEPTIQEKPETTEPVIDNKPIKQPTKENPKPSGEAISIEPEKSLKEASLLTDTIPTPKIPEHETKQEREINKEIKKEEQEIKKLDEEPKEHVPKPIEEPIVEQLSKEVKPHDSDNVLLDKPQSHEPVNEQTNEEKEEVLDIF